MALQNPLSEFNRQNPFVIKAKMQYTTVMTMYESLSKEFLTTSIIAAIDLVASIAMLVIGISLIGWHVVIPFAVGVGFLCICEFIAYKVLRECVQDPDNAKMDEMSSIEMNQVAEVNIEFVYELINIIYSLQGKAHSARRFMKLMSYIMTCGICGYLVCILTLILS